MAAMLYFLLTLDFPRDEYADQSELEAALGNPIVPITERWAEVPGELAHCIDRALSDDIHVRPRDAAQLRKDMTAALAMYDPVPPDNSQLPKDATEARDVPTSASAELSSDSLVPVRSPGSSLRHPERSAHDRSGSWGEQSIEHFAQADLPIAPRPGEPTMVEAWEAVWAEKLADEVGDRVDRHRAIADRYRAIAHLRVLMGRVSQSVHVFQSGGTSVGRVGGGCDFLIDDERMSRRHARIERGATGWRLQDLTSRNGSFVDGFRVSAGETMNLAEGSVIRLGNTLMVFRTSAPTSDGRADSPVFPGISPMVVAVRRRIDALASGAGHVLILGETGTGKAHVAKAIGERRVPHPFVTLNSAELSRDLARSELFGHVRGAFGHVRGASTHAASNWPGLVDMARDGVLFLDEIGELSLDVQAELLRFLEDGSYRPLGSTKLRHSNARVVASTHVDLDEAVQNNRFHRDLLARLRASNAPLELPPLRERREDILGWTQLFLRQGNHDAGPTPWTVGALECLLLYPWARNLRGLGSIVAEATSRSQTFPCGAEHLSAELRQHRETLARGTPDQLPVQSEPTEAEIQEALRDAQGHVRTAAEQLGIDRRKLYQLCERLGIKLEAYRADHPPEDE